MMMLTSPKNQIDLSFFLYPLFVILFLGGATSQIGQNDRYQLGLQKQIDLPPKVDNQGVNKDLFEKPPVYHIRIRMQQLGCPLQHAHRPLGVTGQFTVVVFVDWAQVS